MIEDKLLKLFLEVASIEGLSRDEKDVADFITAYLLKYGFTPFKDNSNLESNSNTGNIICKINGGGNMVLLSHMDTARSTNGLKPVLLSDRITSDGTTVLGVDNRAGISILLYLIEKIETEKIKTKDFTLAFTTCEETTLAGSKNLDLNGRIKKGFVFDSYLRPGNFINSSFGAASFNIKIIGKASHSGIAPEKGINSIRIANEAICKMNLGRIDEQTTINVGLINGGTAVNVVPEITTVKGEVRAKSLMKAEQHIIEIEKLFAESATKYSGKIEFESNWDFKPFEIKETSTVYSDIKNAIRKIGLEPVSGESWGGSDANSLNMKGIESVNIGIGAQNPHSNDEFILYEDLQKSFEIALELVKA